MVFNHKLGADEKEQVHVFKVDANNRNDIDDRGFDALAYTRFTFPGRRACIPSLSGITHASAASTTLSSRTTKVFKIANDYGDDGWNDQVDDEKATTTI